jgi:hypothetical protein
MGVFLAISIPEFRAEVWDHELKPFFTLRKT